MKIQTTDRALQQWAGDCLGIGFFEDQVEQSEQFSTLNPSTNGLLQEIVSETEFKGKLGESAFFRSPSGSARKVVLVGLGKVENWNLEGLRQASAGIARGAQKQKSKTLGVMLPFWNDDAAQSTGAIVEGIELSMHQDNRFKSEPDKNGSTKSIEQVEIIGAGVQVEAIAKAQQICQGVILARELVNAPANVVTPISLAETAAQIAQSLGLTLEVLEKEQCEALGMGAFLCVGQASDLPPKFIHLTYKPQGTAQRKLAIIGKGLTFDSGGLNLKPTGSGIETMKMDMAGSAATLGTAHVVGLLKPNVEVHFIVAATENMISGRAIHPGDVVTASNGKTIEINNTDAEGRLTLADALVFAEKLGVDAIVDLATLTGACVVALGNDIAGVWSPEDNLANAILSAAELAGEKMWRMPLEDKYFEGIKSMIADMKNTGPRPGGSITAALFLKQFIKDTPWVHLDVAGPVWTEKESGYNNPGATGYAVRSLVNWVLANAETSEHKPS
jgi:leucyl aminopeptidase